jgi:hypothetical protein
MVKRILCALICLLGLSWSCIAAAEPSASPFPSPSPAASESPVATIAQSVTDISAQRAAAERSKIYRAGRDYSLWLDEIAKDSGSAFLQRTVFERVTWMRLLASIGAIALLSILAGSFVWIVRRRAGEIQSHKHQSALQLAASALRKPLAFFIWMCGGAFALMPIATGIIGRPTRIFYVGLLTAILYAGWIIALLWLAFRAVLAAEKRMNEWADRTGSVVGKVIIPIAGHTFRLAVPLLGVILLLPLLRLPDNWTWATEKGFGILLIGAFSVLIIRGVNAVQSALMSRHRLDAPDNLSARKIFTQVSVIRKIIVTAVVIVATGSRSVLRRRKPWATCSPEFRSRSLNRCSSTISWWSKASSGRSKRSRSPMSRCGRGICGGWLFRLPNSSRNRSRTGAGFRPSCSAR